MFRPPVNRSESLIYSYDNRNHSNMSTTSKNSPKPEITHERQNSKVTVFDDNLEEHFKRSLNLHNKQKSQEPENCLQKILASVKSEPTSPNQKNSLNSSKTEVLSWGEPTLNETVNGQENGNINGNLHGNLHGNVSALNSHNRTSSWSKRNLPNSFFNKPKNGVNLPLHSRSQSFDPEHILNQNKNSPSLHKHQSVPSKARRKKPESKKNSKSGHTRMISAPVDLKQTDNSNILSPNFGSEFSSASNISIAEEQNPPNLNQAGILNASKSNPSTGPIRGSEKHQSNNNKPGHQRSKSGVISGNYSKTHRVHRRENSQPYSVEPHALSNPPSNSETGSNMESNVGSPLNRMTMHGSRELLDIKFDSLKFEKFDPKLPVQTDFMAGNDYGNGTAFGHIPNTFPGSIPNNVPIMNSGPPNQTISPNQTFPNGEPDSTGLPEGWQMMWDPRTSRMFYIDHNTKRTTWNDPRLFFETNSMDTGFDNSISHAQNNNTISSGQYQFQASSGHHPQTSFDSQITGNSNSLAMDSRNASQDTNQNLMGSSNSLNKPVRPSNLGVASKAQVKQEPFGYNHQNSMGSSLKNVGLQNGGGLHQNINHRNLQNHNHQFPNQQHFQNNQNCPPENSHNHQSHNPPPNLTVTLPSQQITPNTSFNTHSQQYTSNNNDNNNNFHQYDDQTITPTVQNQMPGFQMDVNTTPTPGGVNNQPEFRNIHNNPNLHQHVHQNRQSLLPNSGVLGSPVLPDDLCDELVELLFSGGHNKQTHL